MTTAAYLFGCGLSLLLGATLTVVMYAVGVRAGYRTHMLQHHMPGGVEETDGRKTQEE